MVGVAQLVIAVTQVPALDKTFVPEQVAHEFATAPASVQLESELEMQRLSEFIMKLVEQVAQLLSDAGETQLTSISL